MTPELRPHQEYALKRMHNGSILWGGVGAGKSRVGMKYYVDNESPKDLIVITTAKKRDSGDWVDEGAKFTVGTERDASAHGMLTVDSWNNLHKYTAVSGQFFIFDEQRLVGSGAWTKAFLKIAKNNNWIMLSATPGDTWLDYIPVFVANGFYPNRTAFKREHVVYSPYTKYPKVDRYLGVQKLVKLRSQILVKMPYDKQTVRHEVTIWSNYNQGEMARVEKSRWNVFKDQPIKNAGELCYVSRQVVNSDQSRLVHLADIVAKHKRVIVFYNFNYELAMIRHLAKKLPFAEWNGHKHEEIPETSQWVYAVQYAAGAEGWNCITTDTVVFWSLPYSYKLWEQSHGRIDRLDSPYINLNYYVFRSKAKIDWAVWSALKAKKNFQVGEYGGKFPQNA